MILPNQGARITANEGSQIQKNSFMITVAPATLKNSQPTGDERIGLKGRKKRSVMNGAKNATPNAPSTRASKTA